MSDILIHAAQQQASLLARRLLSAISSIDHADAARLCARIEPHEHPTPQLVFTGQYSSGKSTLIKALTDGSAEVVIDSDIATDTVTPHDWDGLVTLIDTPGVQSGIDRHDALAEAAIAAADLVLFVVTPDLFDDAGVTHLRHIVDDLGKADQLLIILSKANTMTAAPGVREAAVRKALAATGREDIPFVECDAKYYLRGLDLSDQPVRRQGYVARSNLQAVRDAINDITATRGDLARYQQPLQNLSAVAAEAQALITDDPHEAAALALLARQRASLTARRGRIEADLQILRSTFLVNTLQAAEFFADGIESIEHLPDGPERTAQVEALAHNLNQRLDHAAGEMGQGITRHLQIQFDDLASEVREIEASPHARVVLALGQPGPVQGPLSAVRVTTPSGSPAARQVGAADWAAQAADLCKKFQSKWGAGVGTGISGSSGTAGHRIVLDVGHFFGTRFKPWQAVRVAHRIGQATRVAGAALAVGAEVGRVVGQERTAVKAERLQAQRRRALVDEVQTQAVQIVGQAVGEVHAHLDPLFASAYEEIDSVDSSIRSAQSQRSSLTRELEDIRDQASAMASQLSRRNGVGTSPEN